MNRKTKTLRITSAMAAAIADGLANGPGVTLAGTLLSLAKADPGTLPDEPTIANMEEASFAGYAAIDIAAAGGFLGPVNAGVDISAAMFQALFIGGAVVAPGEVITGYFLTDDPATAVIAYEMFDNPVPIGKADDYLELDLFVAQHRDLTVELLG